MFNLLISEDRTLTYSSHFYYFWCYTISCCIMRCYLVSYGFRSRIIQNIVLCLETRKKYMLILFDVSLLLFLFLMLVFYFLNIF